MSQKSSFQVGMALPAIRKRGSYFAGCDKYATALGDVIMTVLTPIGCRPYRRSFGCAVSQTLFDPVESSSAFVQYAISQAVQANCPQVNLKSVTVQNTGVNLLSVRVTFSLANENNVRTDEFVMGTRG